MSWQPGEPGEPPAGAEVQHYTIRLSALADEWKAEKRDAAAAADASGARAATRADADRANERALYKTVHDGYVAVATASLERALQRGTFIVTAASAIVTLYTGLLGLRFATSQGNELIPLQGLIPALYLGAAIGLAAVYVSFLKDTKVNITLLPTNVNGEAAEDRLRAFLFWVFSGVLDRSWAIRGAVGALALGAATLPLPFIQVSNSAAWWAEVGWILVVVLALGFSPRPWEKQQLPDGNGDVQEPLAAALD